MRFFKGDYGMAIPFKIVQGDGTTAKNLTSMTVKLYLKDRDGAAPTGSPITGTVTDASNGLCSFTIPSGMFATEQTKYTAQIEVTGTSYRELTESFNIDVDANAVP